MKGNLSTALFILSTLYSCILSTKVYTPISSTASIPISPVSLPSSISNRPEILLSEVRRAVVEKGKPAEYQISLSASPPPSQTVTIYLNVAETPLRQINVYPTMLNFTADNWNQAKVVNINAIDDNIAEATKDINIHHSVLDSNDLGYYFASGLSTVSVRVYDDDVAGIHASILSHNNDVNNQGKSRTIFTVQLESQPLSNVEVSMLSTFKNLDTLSTTNGVAIEPSVLLFTPDTWTTTQTFTIIQSAMKNEKIEKEIALFMQVNSNKDVTYHHIEALFTPKYTTTYILNSNDMQELRPNLCPSGFSCSTTDTKNKKILIEKCAGGHYCPMGNKDPIICPAGTYCPYGASVPLQCPLGTSCDAGSIKPTICLPGTIGNDPQRKICNLCPSGWICNAFGMTSSLHLIPCPRGYYCPSGTTDVKIEKEEITNGSIGSAEEGAGNGATDAKGAKGATAGDVAITSPVPCPPGTHQPYESTVLKPNTNMNSCIDCSIGTHSPHPGGNINCLRCPRTSRSEIGDTTCTCIGANRQYKPSSTTSSSTYGTCQCLHNHISYDR